MKKLVLELILVAGIAIMCCVIFAKKKTDETDKTTIAESETAESTREVVTLPLGSSGAEGTGGESTEPEAPSFPIPEAVYADIGFVTDSDAWCILDDSGTVLAEKSAAEAFAPASITKVLTALVVLEHVSLDEMVVIREEDILSVDIMSSGVYPSLKSGEVLTVRDLLYALILPSTNAAGSVLASYVAGDQALFADMMNEKLTELGLSHSHFVNPHGLDADGHYVCAYDMCVILKAACENPELRTILGAASYTIPATDYTEARTVVMGHRFVPGVSDSHCEGVFAGKPGGSIAAGNSLVTAVERNGKTLYVCTLHSDEGLHYDDTANLIEGVYARLAGTAYQATTLVHDMRIEAVNGTEITVSFSADNAPASVNCVLFYAALGGETADIFPVPLQGTGRQTFTFSVAGNGTYELQIHQNGVNGELRAISGRFLVTGTTPAPGMMKWNGQTYLIKENGFLYIGAAEIPGGFYYANSDGGLAKGFVGGRFYAGDDFGIVTGWFTADNDTYYAGADGRIVTGRAMIGGEIYEFTDYGALIKN